MSQALKENDVLELSKLYEAEFNQPDIHDRVLVFDVVGSASLLLRSQTKTNIEENEGSEDEASTHSIDEQIKTETSMNNEVDNEAERTEDKETQESTRHSGEKESESNDCEIRADLSKTDENEASDEIKTDDIQAAREASETEDGTKATKNETRLNESLEITCDSSYEKNKSSLQNSEIVTESSKANLDNKKRSENDLETENYGSNNPINKDEIIRQHKFYIHSSWLALQSTYFRSMFFSGMKESNAREVHVQISVCEEKYHLMLLEAMYKIDILNKASVDELLEVLRLAHKYDVKFVFKKSKYCLQAAVLSLEICEQVMRFIKIDNEIPDVDDLASTLQSFLAKEFCPLDTTWQTTNFEELCEPSLRYLLSSDDLVAVSENTVFHALIHWIKQRGLDNVSNGLPSLLSLVRLELIPIDYLYNIVQHNPVAKNLADFNEHYLRGISYHALSEKIAIKQTISCKPLTRKGCAEFDVQYRWVIPTDQLLKLLETERKLISDIFWFCGYKMIMKISHVQQQERTTGGYTAKLWLEIINLTQQNVVDISWQPVSESFNLTHFMKTHTFRKNEHASSADIKYIIKTKQNLQSGNIGFGTVLPGSAFFSGFTPVSQTTGGIFGGVAPVTQQSTGLFSGFTPVSQTTGGIFGGVAPVAQQSTGIFGATAPVTQQSGGLFSSAAPITQRSGSLFSVAVPVPQSSGGLLSGKMPMKPSEMNSPEPESATTPCLSITIKIKLL